MLSGFFLSCIKAILKNSYLSSKNEQVFCTRLTNSTHTNHSSVSEYLVGGQDRGKKTSDFISLSRKTSDFISLSRKTSDFHKKVRKISDFIQTKTKIPKKIDEGIEKKTLILRLTGKVHQRFQDFTQKWPP